MNRKNKAILAVIAVISLLFCVLIFYVLKDESEPVSESGTAGSLSELEFCLTFRDDSNMVVKPWLDEASGDYHIFVPASVKTVKVLNPGDLVMEEAGITEDLSGQNLVKALSPGSSHIFKMTSRDGIPEQASFTVERLDDIPTLFLETQSGNIDHISEVKGNEEPGALQVYDGRGISSLHEDLKAVSARGNTSFFAPKKNYVMDFGRSLSVLGDKSSDKWYLMSQYADGSMIRTVLAYSYVEDYTDLSFISVQYVDLYVNGIYEGLYLLGRNRSAVNIGLTDLEEINLNENPDSKQNPPAQVVSDDGNVHSLDIPRTPYNHSGGYMIEVIDGSEYASAFPAFVSSRGIFYEIKSPDNASYEEVMYMKNFIDEMEAAIYSPDGINPTTGKRFDEYLDVRRWAEYFLVKEGMSDADISLNISVFACKDSDDKSTKLQMGPVWDLDTLFGVRRPQEVSYMSDAEFLQGTLIYADGLLEFGDVREQIDICLNEQLIPWYENDMTGTINDLYGTMQDSYVANSIRWPDDWSADHFNSPEGKVMTMNDYMGRRCDFLRSVFSYGETWHKVTYISQDTVCKEYMVKDGEHLKYVADPVNYFGVFAGWKTDSVLNAGTMDDVTVGEDITFEAVWIEGAWLLERDMDSIKKAISETDILLLDPDELDSLCYQLENVSPDT